MKPLPAIAAPTSNRLHYRKEAVTPTLAHVPSGQRAWIIAEKPGAP
jgi:hypothetical protein